MTTSLMKQTHLKYCRTHNVSICLCIAYIACGSASLYIKTLYFFLTVLALSAAATVANIKIRYDAKIHQFAIFGTCVIYVFYSIALVLLWQPLWLQPAYLWQHYGDIFGECHTADYSNTLAMITNMWQYSGKKLTQVNIIHLD